MKRVLLKSLAISSCCASLLFGYDISDAVKSAEPPKELPNVEAPKPLSITQESREVLEADDGERTLIKDFALEDSPLEPSLFEGVFAPHRNKELSLKDINDIGEQITKIYKEKGYMMARAVIPKQDIGEEGVLSIQVVVGRYGKISLTNGTPIADAVVKGTLESTLEKGEAIKQGDVERAILLVGDMPSAQIPKALIYEGESFGTSDFEFGVEKGERWGGYVGGDNYGSKLTGRYRLSAGLDVNAPFAIADKVSLFGMVSNKADIKNGRAAYAFPIYYDGLRGEVSYAKTDYELGEEYKGLDAVGEASIFEGALSYPLVRSQYENLYLKFSYAAKELSDEIRAVNNKIPKRIDVAALGASYDKYTTIFGLNTYVGAALNVYHGKLKIKDDAQEALNRAGADTVGSYSKADLALLLGVYVSDTVSFVGSVKAQKTLNNKNLDGTEQMSISGLSGVRGYPDSEYSADNGYVLGLEANYKLPPLIGIIHNVGLFFDNGRGKIENSAYTTAKNRTLSDVGLAYSAKYRDFFIKTQAARIIGGEKVESEKEYDTRLLVQVGATF